MNIAYYMPFKPLGHPNPSGDLVLGTELHNHLVQAGHHCRLVSRLRCRWIYLHPGKLAQLVAERRRVRRMLRREPADLWLSYHSYYKAPDMLGPWCARRLGIPYVIFQGIYATKYRRRLLTWPGFQLNRRALLAADMVFTNKRRDLRNLLRLLPTERVRYIAPGLHTAAFTFDAEARRRQRRSWGVTDEVVVMAAAMFRPGVKTIGLMTVIASCGELLHRGRNIRLVIAGDGSSRAELQANASRALGARVTFCGRIERNMLSTVYSGADIFAFPGVEESLGMVYLEAQSCGLPVVAYGDWGGGEAVADGVTGLLAPATSPHLFTDHIDRLAGDAALRRQLGRQGAARVRAEHELTSVYTGLAVTLAGLAGKR